MPNSNNRSNESSGKQEYFSVIQQGADFRGKSVDPAFCPPCSGKFFTVKELDLPSLAKRQSNRDSIGG